MPNDIERERDLITHPHEPMRRRCSFHFEVVAINAEFTLRSQIVSSEGDLCWNRDLPSHAMQREIARNLQVILICTCGFTRDRSTAKSDIRILVRLEYDFA